MRAKYDTIGVSYAELRKPDPRIARIIESALGSAETVLNVGAWERRYAELLTSDEYDAGYRLVVAD
jgi:hypothetical protein